MSKTWQLSSYVSKCPGSVRWKCKCYQNVQTWTWVFFINIISLADNFPSRWLQYNCFPLPPDLPPPGFSLRGYRYHHRWEKSIDQQILTFKNRSVACLLQPLGLHQASVDSVLCWQRGVWGVQPRPGGQTLQPGEAGSCPPAQPLTRIFLHQLQPQPPSPKTAIHCSFLYSCQYR